MHRSLSMLIVQFGLPLMALIILKAAAKNFNKKNYLFRYAFKPIGWNADILSKAKEYWELRGFECVLQGLEITGKRGSAEGNKRSNDMTKLICSLTIKPNDSGQLISDLLVDGRYQYLTPWNKADFELEQLVFRNVISGKPEPDFVAEYRKERVKKNRISMLFSKAISPKWREKFNSLAEDGNMPIFEEKVDSSKTGL